MPDSTPNGHVQTIPDPDRRMAWFKHWNTMRHDIAVKQLSDRQHRRWCWLLELASQVDQKGYVPNALLKAEGITSADISAMVVLSLVDPATGGVQVSSWMKRQESEAQRVANAERQRRFRANQT